MTLRTDINRAQRLSDELDAVNQALALVAAGNFRQTLELSTDDRSGARVTMNISSANLNTMLNSRKTVIESLLASLGVT